MSKTAFHSQIAYQEQLHEKSAYESSKQVLEQYEIAYSLCDEILYDIELFVNMEDDFDRQAISIILFRIMGTLQSIKWLFLKGYYYDAAVLQRSLIESVGACCYISQNKGIGKKWFAGEKLCRSSDMFEAIGKTLKRNMVKEYPSELYRYLCKFVHGNKQAIETLITEVEDEADSDELKTIRFSIPSPYNKKIVDCIAQYPLVTLLVIQELFPETSDYDKQQITEIEHSIHDLDG
jgi:hypothetical protein